MLWTKSGNRKDGANWRSCRSDRSPIDWRTGTQLTLRMFHVGGVAANIATDSKIISKYDGVLSIDELRALEKIDENGKTFYKVIGRSAEMKVIDKNRYRFVVFPYSMVLISILNIRMMCQRRFD